MQSIHTPTIGPRYWAALTVASVLGTNLGDLYAHESGLGVLGGLAILAGLFLLLLAFEARDRSPLQWHYWVAILLVRTSATNIADVIGYDLHVPLIVLSAGLAVLLVGLTLLLRPSWGVAGALSNTGWLFWAAMLTAGTFGTAMGDYLWHKLGIGPTTLGLTLVWGTVYALGRHRWLTTIFGYWAAVALVRTTGTAIGDYLAEGRFTHLGLALATLCSGAVYMGLLWFWPVQRPRAVT